MCPSKRPEVTTSFRPPFYLEETPHGAPLSGSVLIRGAVAMAAGWLPAARGFQES